MSNTEQGSSTLSRKEKLEKLEDQLAEAALRHVEGGEPVDDVEKIRAQIRRIKSGERMERLAEVGRQMRAERRAQAEQERIREAERDAHVAAAKDRIVAADNIEVTMGELLGYIDDWMDARGRSEDKRKYPLVLYLQARLSDVFPADFPRPRKAGRGSLAESERRRLKDLLDGEVV